MTDTTLSPAQYAEKISASRQRLTDFAQRCTDEQWASSPVDGDPRPVGVIVDHVGHAYEYLAKWITELINGGSPLVDSEIVDGLNADHAAQVGVPTPAQATGHLKSSGDALITVVNGLSPDQLELGEGRVARFLVIADRHADNHRTEIEEQLG
jgi:DinB superfamily